MSTSISIRVSSPKQCESSAIGLATFEQHLIDRFDRHRLRRGDAVAVRAVEVDVGRRRDARVMRERFRARHEPGGGKRDHERAETEPAFRELHDLYDAM